MLNITKNQSVKATILAMAIGAIGWGISAIQVAGDEMDMVKGVLITGIGMALLLVREFVKKFDNLPDGDVIEVQPTEEK